MNLENNTTITLEKGKKKVKSYLFKSKKLKRDLAVHECLNNKNYTSISDVKTGMRLCDIQSPVKSLKESDITARIEEFIKHFTLLEILKRFEELDKTND